MMPELIPALAEHQERKLHGHAAYVTEQRSPRSAAAFRLNVYDFFVPANAAAMSVAEGAELLAEFIAAVRTDTMLADSGAPVVFSPDEAKRKLLGWIIDHRIANGTLRTFDAWLAEYPVVAPYVSDDHLDQLLADHASASNGEILQMLNGPLAVTFWNRISPTEQWELAHDLADVVVRNVIENGGSISSAVRRELKRALAYVSTNVETWASLDIHIPFTNAFFIDLGGGARALVSMLSSGEVEVQVLVGGHVGGGAQADGKAGEADVSIGAFAERAATFIFASEHEAANAVRSMIDKASSWEFLLHAGGRFLLSGVFFSPYQMMFGRDDKLTDLIEDYQDVQTVDERNVGVTITGEVNGEAGLSELEAEVEATMDVDIEFHHHDHLLDDDQDYQGFRLSGEFSAVGTVEADPFALSLGQTGTIGGAVEVRQFDNGVTDVVITLETEYGDAGNIELLDQTAIDVDQQVTTTATGVTRIVIPYNAQTSDIIKGFIGEAANGNLPRQSLAELYDVAEITRSTADQTAVATTAEFVDSAFEVEVEQGSSVSTTTSVTHKPSGREAYDVIDYNRVVDEAMIDVR